MDIVKVDKVEVKVATHPITESIFFENLLEVGANCPGLTGCLINELAYLLENVETELDTNSARLQSDECEAIAFLIVKYVNQNQSWLQQLQLKLESKPKRSKK